MWKQSSKFCLDSDMISFRSCLCSFFNTFTGAAFQRGEEKGKEVFFVRARSLAHVCSSLPGLVCYLLLWWHDCQRRRGQAGPHFLLLRKPEDCRPAEAQTPAFTYSENRPQNTLGTCSYRKIIINNSSMVGWSRVTVTASTFPTVFCFSLHRGVFFFFTNHYFYTN